MNTQRNNAQAVLKNVFHAIVPLTVLPATPSHPHHFGRAANALTNACPAEPQSLIMATMSAKPVIHRVWNVRRANQRIAKHVGLINLRSFLVAHASVRALPGQSKTSQK